jgi:hypothetical protein
MPHEAEAHIEEEDEEPKEGEMSQEVERRSMPLLLYIRRSTARHAGKVQTVDGGAVLSSEVLPV